MLPAKIPHRAIWRMAVPTMVTNIATALIGIVDTWAIGQSSDVTAMGGVAIGAMLVAIFLFSFNFLRMGTTALVAQAFGAKNAAEQPRILLRAMAIGALLSGLFLLLKFWIMPFGLTALEAQGKIYLAAKIYAGIRINFFVLCFWNMAAVGLLMGLQKPRTVLGVEILYNLVNAGLCIYLVTFSHAGPAGVAWASVSAEIIKFMVLACIILKLFGASLTAAVTDALTWQAQALWKLFKFNRDLFLRTTLLMLSLAAVTRTGAQAGPVALAANQILMQFFFMSAVILDGFEAAAQTLGGAQVGARNRPEFSAMIRGCFLGGGVVAVVIALGYALTARWVIGQFTDVASVQVQARSLWLWTLPMPLVGIIPFVYDGIFIGAGWTRAMLISMVASAALLAVILVFAVPHFGMHGLWLGFLAMFLARGAAQAILYPRLAARTFAA
jgi:multidrug resistance protein, MATE family